MTGALDGKVAIITGAAGGQGACEARLFVDQGASVVLTDLDPSGVEVARALGDSAIFFRHDVSDEKQWTEIVEKAVSHFGRLDILVNNAGIYRPRSLLETDVDNFDIHYRINQLGPYLGMRAVAAAMRDSGGGSIVNIGSGSGATGSPGIFAYAATKWALRGLSKCASKDLAAFNIRVNAILPGLIGTKMVDVNAPEMMNFLVANTPMQRLGEADEIARVVAFVASDAASFMTGAEIAVDGGLGV